MKGFLENWYRREVIYCQIQATLKNIYFSIHHISVMKRVWPVFKACEYHSMLHTQVQLYVMSSML